MRATVDHFLRRKYTGNENVLYLIIKIEKSTA